MQTKPFRIGTRGSPLALAQAHETRDRLMAAHGLPAEMFEIVVLSTMGDRITDRSLAADRRQGPVHPGTGGYARSPAASISPSIPPRTCRRSCRTGLFLSAYLPREDTRDAFIGRTAPKLIDLPHGATVGSSSLRRQALIKRLRPDINVITFAASSIPGCASWPKARSMRRCSPSPA